MLYIKTLGGMGSSGELLATSSVCLYRWLKGVSFKRNCGAAPVRGGWGVVKGNPRSFSFIT